MPELRLLPPISALLGRVWGEGAAVSPTEVIPAADARRVAKVSRRTVLEDQLVAILRRERLPAPAREYLFAKDLGRRWRFDLAWPEQLLAVEVDGGIWIQGRHTRGSGQLTDMEKMNTAALLGWRVLRVGRQHIVSGQAEAWVRTGLGMAR